jgi:hypothetical protein
LPSLSNKKSAVADTIVSAWRQNVKALAVIGQEAIAANS